MRLPGTPENPIAVAWTAVAFAGIFASVAAVLLVDAWMLCRGMMPVSSVLRALSSAHPWPAGALAAVVAFALGSLFGHCIWR